MILDYPVVNEIQTATTLALSLWLPALGIGAALKAFRMILRAGSD